VVPGLSALGAVLFLGEPLSVSLLGGLALVTLGILFGVRAAGVRTPVSVATNDRSTLGMAGKHLE
jgi:drug/metabolite transporter (DMT)-like permease